MKNTKPRKSLPLWAKIAIAIGSTLLLLLVVAYIGLWILINGPSPNARRLFVNSVKETSAAGFLPSLFLSREEIDELMNAEDDMGAESDIDYSLIVIPEELTPTDPKTPGPSGPSRPTRPGDDPGDTGIEVVDIIAPRYNGKLLIVKDPKRLIVGVPDHYGENASGLTVEEMIEKYGAVAGINGGGFYDPNGQGTGGIPDGLVIYEGKLLWGSLTKTYSVAGIDAKGILYTSKMTGQQALNAGIQYAASFGPPLVANGKIVTTNDSSLNPRTAIGQRADGALLLLVINGRSVSSIGASYLDVASVMVEYGAVNATNLDGGSSSIMIYNNEYLTDSAYIFGLRVVATAFLIK